MTADLKEIQNILGIKVDGIFGPQTLHAVSAALKCNKTIRDIQKAVGVTTDGLVGPKTVFAIKTKIKSNTAEANTIDNIVIAQPGSKTIFLDPGHTADHTREWPSEFNKDIFLTSEMKEIMNILSFNYDTKDSIEHILNVAIATKAEQALKALGFNVVLYDDPSLSNNAEIAQVYTRVNKLNPVAFVSIHNNATGMAGWANMACKATGTVALYYNGRANGKTLATYVADELIQARKNNGGPHNRADKLAISSVAVLSKTKASIPTTLVEVGFYDSLTDLHWMATHLDIIGKAIATGINKFLSK